MASKPARIILDTNLWISFLIKKDFSKLDLILKNKRAVLLFSNELLDEFIEVAQRPAFIKFFSKNDLSELLSVIDQVGEFIVVRSETSACRDLKDNFLLSLAKDGNADYLVSGDKDLLDIGKYGNTKIITMREYLAGL